MKRTIKGLTVGIVGMLCLSAWAYAKTGLLFNINESGNQTAVDVVLCLNGKGPLSCQNYHVSAQNLDISTMAMHHYPAAGIKVLTPGYRASGCTPYPNGYCLFAVNAQTPTTIILNDNTPAVHTVGGTISGLAGSVSLQNNGGDTLTQSSDGSFAFSTPIAEGSTYVVTISSQPATQTCTVNNGTGTIGSSNVTNVDVTCMTNMTALSVDATGTIPVGSGFGSITVTNTGNNTAYNVFVTLPSGWTEVIQNFSNCTSIAPNGTCTLTFTTTTPYGAQGSIPVIGDNISNTPTTALAFTVQGYLVWEVSSATTVQVIDTSDLSTSAQWGGLGTAIGSNAQSLTDGIGNTSAIVTALGTGSTYAALFCNQSTRGGVPAGDWYLPAICQMGGAGQGAGCASGLANIDTNLVQLGFGGLADYYWSSTENSVNPQDYAWYEYFASGDGSNQGLGLKNRSLTTPRKVRCALGLTY